jgi:hypothetical protein
MNINLTKTEVELIIEELYICWDMNKEDLNDKKANKIAKVRDKLIEQYKTQEKAEEIYKGKNK